MDFQPPRKSSFAIKVISGLLNFSTTMDKKVEVFPEAAQIVVRCDRYFFLWMVL